MTKKIAITQIKGGVGKTTIAVNLAHWFHLQGHKTLLVDGDEARGSIDYQGNAIYSFEDEKRYNKVFPFPVVEIGKEPKEDFDYIIVDTEPHPSTTSLKFFAEEFDLTIFPVIESLSFRQALVLKEIFDKHNGKYMSVVNMALPTINSSSAELQEALHARDLKPAPIMMQQFEAYKKAMNAGQSVGNVIDKQRNRAWATIDKLAREIVARTS